MINNDLNFREDDDKKLAMYHYADKSKSTLTVKQVKSFGILNSKMNLSGL